MDKVMAVAAARARYEQVMADVRAAKLMAQRSDTGDATTVMAKVTVLGAVEVVTAMLDTAITEECDAAEALQAARILRKAKLRQVANAALAVLDCEAELQTIQRRRDEVMKEWRDLVRREEGLRETLRHSHAEMACHAD